jgi:hypothetical protein
MGRRADQIDEKTKQILAGIEDEDDPRVSWGAVAKRIAALQDEGRQVPEGLVIAERQLMTVLMAESQGR